MRSITAKIRSRFSMGAAVLGASVLLCVLSSFGFSQGVKRVVVIKVDGLPTYYVDEWVKKTDPQTGRSYLPWIEEIFYKNGSRVPNFYVRGMALSGPSWGTVDTGQHLQIKGNVEYDRFTLHSYDYLNFLPFYLGNSLGKKADMPAMEVLDQLGIPVLSDLFPYGRKTIGQQLYQRGNDWKVLIKAGKNLIPENAGEAMDEWTLGLETRAAVFNAAESTISKDILERPEIDYLDYFDGTFDHVSHHVNDDLSRVEALKTLDSLIGRVWMTIKRSSRADETAMVLVSDHGFNSDKKVYSQGYNLVKLLASAQGGGHHVITKRRLMLDYSVKGVYPFVPLITTRSDDSYYLRGESDKYPTALFDFDGNERSSVHLRDSDVNMLHILLKEMKSGLPKNLRSAAQKAFFSVIDRRRAEWSATLDGLGEELPALDRWIAQQQQILAAQPKEYTDEQRKKGIGQEMLRLRALTDLAVNESADYKTYLASLDRLLKLDQNTFDAKKVKIEDLITPGSMGEQNSVNELQNYVVGLGPNGLQLAADGSIDLERSFKRIDYFKFIYSQTVKNNVQPGLGIRPIDFLAARIPNASIRDALPLDDRTDDDAVFLYGGESRQILLLTRHIGDKTEYRYLPVSGFKQDASGKVSFTLETIADGFPLKIFEDPKFAVGSGSRSDFLSTWHDEMTWLNAIHKTLYSNGLIGLNEQMIRHPLPEGQDDSPDARLIYRYRQRQRHLAEADIFISANFHWNFDVRGFNPGGNHGSFFRVSTNSVFMIAGGDKTGIPKGLETETPYDNLSVVPTILRLMRKIDENNQPSDDMKKLGFKKFPGRFVKEITETSK